MRKCSILFYVIFAIYVATSCTVTKKKVKNFSSTINKCVQTYLNITERKTPISADRVYIHEFVDASLSLFFFSGENGSFGKPDIGSSTFMACGISSEGLIVFLGRPFEDPLIDTVITNGEHLYKKEVLEHLYLLEGEKYMYSESQIFSLDRMEINTKKQNGRMLLN